MGKPESVIEKKLVKIAKSMDCRCDKMTVGGGFTDRLLITAWGTVWFVECKAPGKTLDPLQVVFRDDMLERKQRHAVVNTLENLEIFESILKTEREQYNAIHS